MTQHTPGPCHWNGNEICTDANPRKGIAGLAPDSPDEWGPLFAAAPELLEALEMMLNDAESPLMSRTYLDRVNNRDKARTLIAKARGQS